MKKFVPEALAIYYRDTGESITLIADFSETIDSLAVKNLLGHASLSATQIYTHTTIDVLKKSYKKAHPRGDS